MWRQNSLTTPYSTAYAAAAIAPSMGISASQTVCFYRCRMGGRHCKLVMKNQNVLQNHLAAQIVMPLPLQSPGVKQVAWQNQIQQKAHC
jgi:hypothetical protein